MREHRHPGPTIEEERATTVESVSRRLRHRIPWLGIGLLGAMLSAWMVGAAEDELSKTVAVAFFLPAVVYMADAVGTQTEVLAVRGLAVGVPIREIIGKELVTGFLIGLCVSVAFFPFCALVFGDLRLAIAVSVALLVSATLASVVALVLPWFLDFLGKDPAFGSGPISTVIQDLLSIAVYLVLASLIV
mgnify:CR=1 FL=1